MNNTDQFCWYVIPEIIIGIPKYDHSACIAYIIDKLKDNGFTIRYTHPNLIFISWKNWVPTYVRNEIKKQTGVTIDGYGNEVNNDNQNSNFDNNTDNNLLLLQKNKNKNIKINSNNDDFKSIKSYKPSGNIIYNKDLYKNIEDKTS